MNAFILTWRDPEPMTLANGHRVLAGIVSPICTQLKTRVCYRSAFGEKRLTLESLGFLVDATPEQKEAAFLQQLTAATLNLEDDSKSISPGDVFVASKESCFVIRSKVLLATGNPSHSSGWCPIRLEPSGILGWIAFESRYGETEGIFVSDTLKNDLQSANSYSFVFRKSMGGGLKRVEITDYWENKRG